MTLAEMYHDKKEEFAPLFLITWGVSIDEFWIDDETGFDFPKFIFFLQEEYPDWHEYSCPHDLEEDKFGPEVVEMMDRLGTMHP